MTKSNSTPAHTGRKPIGKKPAKPSPDFPLAIHPAGYFSKKIRGHVHYIARWDEGAEVALTRWNERGRSLLAGRTPKDDQDGPDSAAG